MRLKRLHDWNITPKDAVQLQHRLRDKVVVDRPLDLAAIRTVAGVDVSIKNRQAQAAVVVLSFPDFEPVETALAQRPADFPYVPGLLTFREGPVLLDAFGKLNEIPDVFLFDGSGYLHPRRIGLACHMGLWLNKPTVANAKTKLCGEFGRVSVRRGGFSPVTHKDEVIGAALRTKRDCAPVFVSPGHLSDLESAIALVLACSGKYRLPEPVRAAHKAAGAFSPQE